MKPTLFDVFPTPKYLAPPALGIDISDEGIKYVELLRKRGGLELGRFGEKHFEEGVIESGVIKQPQTVRDALRDIHKELKLRTAFVSIMEGQGYSLRLKVAVTKIEEVRGAIELQLEEHVPLKPSEIVFDYDIISTPTTTAPYFVVSVSALPQSIVENYFDVVTESEFEPLAFEIESSAIARAVVPHAVDHPVLIVDMGRLRTSAAVAANGVLGFSATIPIGGEHCTRIIQKVKNSSHEEAEQLKVEKGVIRTGGPDDLFDYCAPLLSALKEEIAKHITFWETHAYESGEVREKIQHIFLAGGAANLLGLPEYLAFNLHLSVTSGNPWVNATSFGSVVPQMTLSESLSYSTAIGLALRAFPKGNGFVITT